MYFINPQWNLPISGCQILIHGKKIKCSKKVPSQKYFFACSSRYNNLTFYEQKMSYFYPFNKCWKLVQSPSVKYIIKLMYFSQILGIKGRIVNFFFRGVGWCGEIFIYFLECDKSSLELRDFSIAENHSAWFKLIFFNVVHNFLELLG